MARVCIDESTTYSIRLTELTEEQVRFLACAFQNSPNGYSPEEEPKEEAELRRAIFEQCKLVLCG